MDNYLDWTRSCTGRLTKEDTQAEESNAKALAERLKAELKVGTLPFLTMPYRQKLEQDLPGVLEKARKYNNMLLLGIGGSALGARAMQKAFAPGQDLPGYKGPWLWIADNVGAAQYDALLSRLDPAETVVVVISKSGGTIETLAQYFLTRAWLKKAVGDAWQNQVIMITDENKGFLRQEASSKNLASLIVPDFLGGRYSALSAVGLLPAAYMGIDWRGLLDGAHKLAAPLVENPDNIDKHPSFQLACWTTALQNKGYSELIFFNYIPQWSAYGAWFAQLWAESLGKDGKGSMPVPATGVTDQHSINQMFLDGPRNKGCIFITAAQPESKWIFGEDLPDQWSWLRGKAFSALLDAEALGTCMALCKSGVPLTSIHMGNIDEKAGGQMMMLLEAATIFTGWLMGINPVDQPAVELGKRLANCRLGAEGYAKEAADLKEFLSASNSRDKF